MSSVAGMLAIFDVEAGAAAHTFTGTSDGGTRAVVDGSQVLAQSIVAAARTVPGKVVRSAHATFLRAVDPERLLRFEVQVVHEGRTFATVIVTAGHGERPCVLTTVLLDVVHRDVVRHPHRAPRTGPDQAMVLDMPMEGRELRLVGVTDPNDPDDVGPAELDAWLRYDEVPARDDLAKALIAHFTGHLSISATLRGHAGFGTSMAHHTLSTAVTTITVTFHEPAVPTVPRWTGWLRYSHESTFVGAGMSHVRGEVITEDGEPIASFVQEAMIRHFGTGGGEARIETAARF